MTRSTCLGVVAVLALIGCGGGGGPDAGGEALTLDEREVLDRGNGSSNACQQLGVLADSLFDFDPTIDPAKTPAENAGAIEARVRNNLGAPDGGFPGDGGFLGCGNVSLSGTTVTVAFGSPPGCTLRNGVKASGTVAVGVTKSGATTTLALTLTQMVVNGIALSGTASFATTSGSTFTVNASLTSGTTTYTITTLTMAGGAGTTTLSGSVSVGTGEGSTSITFNNLTWKLGDCYPSGGSLTSKKGLVTTTITFDASTPTTGQVSVTVGRKTSTATLPAYGSCGVKDGG